MMEKLVKVVGGLLLVVAGIPMLVAPGPGTLFIAGGIALILAQFPWGHRIIARVRVWARDRFGSPRVHNVERRLPREIVPEHKTEELRVIAAERRQPREPRGGRGRRDADEPPESRAS